MTFRIGRADIRKAELKNNAGDLTVDVSNLVHAMSFYEDLLTSHMSCNMGITDATSLRIMAPLTGGESLEVDVGERGERARSLKGKFVVNTMTGRDRDGDTEIYNLNCVTQEHLKDMSIIINKAYRKMAISDMVAAVVGEYFTPITGKKLIENEKTNGMQTIIATGFGPTTLIRQCAREAESIENPNSTYVFFETVEGYHFTTLDNLYKKKAVDTYIWDNVRESTPTPNNYRNIQNTIRYLNIESNFNVMDNQINGGYRSLNQSFNPLTKSFTQSIHTADSSPLHENVTSRYFANPTVKKFLITNDASQNPYAVSKDEENQSSFRRRQNFIGRETSQLYNFASIRLSLSIMGNSNLKVGDTININIPRSTSNVTDRRLNDPLHSGKYLITAIAHNISILNGGEYVSVLEAVAPAYAQKDKGFKT